MQAELERMRPGHKRMAAFARFNIYNEIGPAALWIQREEPRIKIKLAALRTQKETNAHMIAAGISGEMLPERKKSIEKDILYLETTLEIIQMGLTDSVARSKLLLWTQIVSELKRVSALEGWIYVTENEMQTNADEKEKRKADRWAERRAVAATAADQR